MKDHILEDVTLDRVDKIVFCTDYNSEKVKQALGILFSGNPFLLNKFESLNEYRERINDLKAKSCAGSFVEKAYENVKKVNNIHRRHSIFNNFSFVKISDIFVCLDFILARVKYMEEGEICIQEQKSLNTSLLTIYSKTGSP